MGYTRVIGLSVAFLLVVGAIVLVSREPAPRPVIAQEYAPLVPENETEVAPDPAFQEECMGSLRAVIPESSYGGVLFTRSAKWGLVLRVDYVAPETQAPYINRVVCSRNADGKVRVTVSMSQKVPRLKPPVGEPQPRL